MVNGRIREKEKGRRKEGMVELEGGIRGKIVRCK